MSKELRTGLFAGREYKFFAHDVESILTQPGVSQIKSVATTPDQAANSTWWSFEDEAIVRERHWHFRPGDVVLDIGPAFGSYTFTAAVQGARVYAVEPSEFCRAVLTENVAANPELSPQIQVVPAGVHAQSGWFEPEAGEFITDESKRDAVEKSGRELLEVRSVDDIVSGLGLDRIDAIKLDVEGAEFGALLGARKTIARFRPRFLIEEHEFKFAGIGFRCQGLLDSFNLGYRCERHQHYSVAHGYYAIPS